MTREQKNILRDLTKNMQKKIENAIGDWADLVDALNIPGNVAAAELLSNLIELTTEVATHFKFSPDDFGMMCSQKLKIYQEENRNERSSILRSCCGGEEMD
jgi:hypothetical protein